MTLLTEKEAAEKWCPLTFNLSSSDMCVGSRCMAWRWADASERISYDVQRVVKPAGETNPPFSNCPQGYEVSSHWHGFYACRKELSRESPRGYCGAFGKVEP